MRFMQTISFPKLGLILLTSLLPFHFSFAAEQEESAERVMLKEGKMMVLQGGKTVKMEKNVRLPHEIRVTTNGTFAVNSGKKRQLKEGEVLDSDGMLTSPDGSVAPVLDHVAMKNGKLVLVQDGEPSAVDHEIAFPDGSKLVPEG